MTVKERLIQFLDKKEISQGKFEEKVNLSNGFVNNIGDSIRKTSLDKIIAVYPDLNKLWLLHGEGDMLIKENKMPDKTEELPTTLSQIEPKAMDAIFELTQSNRVLADSHKILAETNAKLADKIISATANAPQQIPEAFSTMFSGLQEFLLDVASGKSFLSRQEAAAALMNKFVPEEVKRKAAQSIPNN